MNLHAPIVLALILAVPAAAPRSAGGAGGRDPGPESRPAAVPGIGLPLHFEANRGQFDARARFLARSRGFRTFLADDEAVFVLPVPAPRERDAFPRQGPRWSGEDCVRMRPAGATASARAEGRSRLPGISNYFLGPDPEKWVTRAPHFGEVLQRGIRPGVDLRWRGAPGGRLEYDLLVAPGADAGDIALRFEGQESIAVDAEGSLVLRTRHGLLRHGRPVAWQESAGRRRPVRAEWEIRPGGAAGFDLGPRDPALGLVIDPVVTFSTFHGGESNEGVGATVLGSDGSLFVAGITYSAEFPVANPNAGGPLGSPDAFVSRLAPSGASLIYSTYYGGAFVDFAWGVSVNSIGQATLVGDTDGGIPVVNALQPSLGGGVDAFCARFAADGSSILNSTYIGGNGFDTLYCVALDSAGSLWVAGTTGSTNLPLALAVQGVNWGGYDVYLAKLTPSHDVFLQSTYIGSYGDDAAFGIAVDDEDSVVLTGFASRFDFLLYKPLQPDFGGPPSDAFLYAAQTSGIPIFSTYIGGTGAESGHSVAVAPSGRIFVTGTTDSSDFPVVAAMQAAKGAGADAFVARVAKGGGEIEYATYLGGSGVDQGYSIAVDGAGWAHVGGSTDSADFPDTGALQDGHAGGDDGFLCRIDPTGTSLAWSSYLGGSGSDAVNSVRVDRAGRLVAGGITDSADFPAVAALQGTIAGGQDGFVVALQGPPESPAQFEAHLILGAHALCTWRYHGVPALPVRIERKVEDGDWAPAATLAVGVTTYEDKALPFSTTYRYRAVAVGANADSDPTPEFTVTTPAPDSVPPIRPHPVSAATVSAHRVDVSWTDGSLNESHFLVYRASPTSLYSVVGTAGANAQGFVDSSALPDRSYRYKVRAANVAGLSQDSIIASASTPATMTMALVKGRIVDSSKAGRDSARLSGTFAFGAGAASTSLDPAAQGLSFRFGDFAGAPLLVVPAGSEGWGERRGKHVWRSPKGAPSKVRIVLHPESGTWSLRIARATFAFPSANPVRVSLEVGAEAGHSEDAWTPLKRPGKFRFP